MTLWQAVRAPDQAVEYFSTFRAIWNWKLFPVKNKATVICDGKTGRVPSSKFDRWVNRDNKIRWVAYMKGILLPELLASDSKNINYKKA